MSKKIPQTLWEKGWGIVPLTAPHISVCSLGSRTSHHSVRSNPNFVIQGLAPFATQYGKDAKSSTLSHFFPFLFPRIVPMFSSWIQHFKVNIKIIISSMILYHNPSRIQIQGRDKSQV